MKGLSLRFFRLGGSVFLAGVYLLFPTGAALAQGPTKTATPTETFSLLREEGRVKSGQEFFKGARYVGSTTCKSCHELQYKEWRATWHSKMERWPSQDTIVGDFTLYFIINPSS